MKLLCLLIIVALLAGCTLGAVTVKKSELDNSTHITMKPAIAFPYVQMGLSWNDKLPNNELILEVIKSHGGNISPGESLHFNIDEGLFHFASFDSTSKLDYQPGLHNSVTSMPGYGSASKRYIVSPSFIKKLLAAQRTVIRLDLDREFAEGILIQDPTFFAAYAADFMTEFEKYQFVK